MNDRRHMIGPVLSIAAALIAVGTAGPRAWAHCQVPCGIFDDPARIAQMNEDAKTIGKAISQMSELADKTDVESRQQFTRWVVVKEEHATRIMKIVSDYFLTQKLKPVAADDPGYQDYLGKLAAHHAVLVAAMKCKQNADQQHVEALNATLHTLGEIWAPHHEH